MAQCGTKCPARNQLAVRDVLREVAGSERRAVDYPITLRRPRLETAQGSEMPGDGMSCDGMSDEHRGVR